MTTLTTEEPAKVTLDGEDTSTSEVTAAPAKRRGRPPGSKNRPKDPTATTTTPRAPRATRAATTTAHAILVTNEGIEVLHADGTTETFSVKIAGAPLFDRRK